MGSRLELQSKLEELIGNRNVYYQPPSTVQMNYPAIVYSKQKPHKRFANDKVYSSMRCYQIIVIDKRPDNPVIDKIQELRYSSWDRHYTSENLHHDALTLYY